MIEFILSSGHSLFSKHIRGVVMPDYSYSNFVCDCWKIITVSDKLRDGWKMVEIGAKKSFLSKTETKILNSVETTVDYHVVFDESYQVPVLYFNATYKSGRVVPPNDLYKSLCVPSDHLNFISQRDHPIMDTPFYHIHPCQTTTMMENFKFHLESDFVYLLTFISSVGPLVGLYLPHEYGLPT